MPSNEKGTTTNRARTLSSVIVAAIGCGALALAVLVPDGTLLTPVRATLAIVGAFLIPGWIIVRYSSRQGRWPTIVVEAVVMSMALFVVGTFLLTVFGVRLNTLWYFVVPVIGTAVALIVVRGESAASVLPSPSMWTVGLIVCAIGSAGISHVALPAPSPESSYSIFVPRVLLAADARSFTIPIRIDRVSYARPIDLDVQIDFISVGHIHIAKEQSRMVAKVDLLSPAPCRRDLVELVGPGGQTLTPPVSCHVQSVTSG